MVVVSVTTPSVVVVVVVAAVVGSGPVVGSPVDVSPVDDEVVPGAVDALPVVDSVAEANPLVVAPGPPPQARIAHSGSVVIAAADGPVIREERDIACSSGLAGRERASYAKKPLRMHAGPSSVNSRVTRP
ncbi:hypothetical protein [Nannocystis pusilla]|uniref:hypothetical protein n=1 Tax=Nannocystis pusilla TaxID=889268 RepID=UPI003BF313D0